jgi:biopolymer transport protein ExbB
MQRPIGSTFRVFGICTAFSIAVVLTSFQSIPAQTQFGTADDLADRALSEQTAGEAAAGQEGASADEPELTLPVLDLLWKGGWLMIPIALMSLIVVAVGLERLIALRRGRIFPRRLKYELEGYAARGNFDPRHANQLCQRYPSTAANIMRAMLAKIGRPHSEMERALSDSIQREADRLYAPVRTLNLAAAITPLLGLLGTVWGMIQAFFVTANLPLGSNKGQALAEGIYIALVTTFAGLTVAIPAAILAHIFENRILGRLSDIDHSLNALTPQLEQYEGKVRIDPHHGPHGDGIPAAKSSIGQSKVL